MSIVALPSALSISHFEWGQQRFDLGFASGDSGAQQSRVLAPSRWLASLSSGSNLDEPDADEWTTLIVGLRGRINQLALHNVGKIAPRGTARGTWTANALAAAGAASIVINMGVDQAATTLKKGDFIGVNQSAANRQLLMVQADATADGSGIITVTVEPPLRVQVEAASSMAWDKPTALFRFTGTSNRWSYEDLRRNGFALDLIESWEG